MIDGKTYFAIRCDRCGENLCDDTEHSHWESVPSALEMADDAGLILNHGLLAACPPCLAEYCAKLDDDEKVDDLHHGEAMSTHLLRLWIDANKTVAA